MYSKDRDDRILLAQVGKLAKQSFWGIASAAVGVPIGFYNVSILFADALSPEHNGLRWALSDSALVLSQFAALGSTGVLIRFYAHYAGRGENGSFWRLIALWSLVGIAAIAGLLFLFRGPIEAFYVIRSPLFTDYFYLILPLCAFMLFGTQYELLCTAQQRAAFPMFVREVGIRLMITLLLFLYVQDVMSIERFWQWYVGIYAFSLGIVAAYAHGFRVPRFSRRITRLKENAEMVRFGLYSLVGGAAAMMVLKIDILILAGLCSLGETWVYGYSVFLTSLIEIPKRVIKQISTAPIAEAWQQNDQETLARVYRSGALMMWVLALGIFGAIWLGLPAFYQLVPKGDLLEEGLWVFLVLGITRLIDIGCGANGEIISYSPHYRTSFWATIGLLVITLVSDLIAVPPFGIMGAALATLLSYVVYNLFSTVFVGRKYGHWPFSKGHLTSLLLAVVAGLALWWVSFGNPWVDLGVRSVGFLVIYGVLLLSLRVVPQLNASLLQLWRRLR